MTMLPALARISGHPFAFNKLRVDICPSLNARNIQQAALWEQPFFPAADRGQAMALVVAVPDRAMSRSPKGTLPFMISRRDAGRAPAGDLVSESET